MTIHFTTADRLTMWRALAARRGRLSDVDWRSSLQAQHLNGVQGVNAARQAADVPPWVSRAVAVKDIDLPLLLATAHQARASSSVARHLETTICSG